MPYSLVSYAVTIIITVIISVAVLFTIILVIIVCICLHYKYKQSSQDGKIVANQPTQPVPVYETVMECTTVDLEMTENVAYAPIHTLSRKT